jgi:HEPN domain-containing protein
MQFRAEEYYQAGLERIRQARTIHEEGGNYALSMYCSGLAVECSLRAFRWKEETSFEGRHDLTELLKASGILKINEEFMRRKKIPEDEISRYGIQLRAAMNEVVALWHNNFRFASERSLEAYPRRNGRFKGIKGDPLKKISSDLLEAAHTIITRGVALWTSKTRS